jgi:signal transduction histidine kinase
VFTIPIRWRLTLYHAVTTLLVALILIGMLFVLIAQTIDRDTESTARARAYEAVAIIEAGKPLTADDLDRLGRLGAYVVARDAQGNILAQTRNAHSQEELDKSLVWREALATGEVVEQSQTMSWFASGPTSYLIAIPIVRADSAIRVIEAGRSYGGPGRDLVSFTSAALVGALALFGVLLAIGGSFLLARAAMSPVKAIVASAREITESDLSRRLPVKRKRDELGKLASAFNDLLARLDVAFRQRDEALTQQRRFVADASHELRTPLTSIQGYARMLKQWALEDPETAKESIGAIEREAARMNLLVENLFRLAHGDETAHIERANYDLRVLAASAVDSARAAQNRSEITLMTPNAPVVATIDRPRIHQVLTILLDNAVKYSPNGGEVTVELSSNGKYVKFEVKDAGIGIPEADLPHIFDRFYRVDAARTEAGAGLGLSIAKQIAEQHGGNLAAKSVLGQGSTFTLRLPVDAQSDEIIVTAKRDRFWKRIFDRSA